jgi:hypothetical protein
MQRPPGQFSHIQFRVLIIGRANAGKTSILQRVCDTTQSPTIYRRTEFMEERVRGLNFSQLSQSGLSAPPDSTRPIHGGQRYGAICRLLLTGDPFTQRGEHSIDDELVFSNHDGYIFHDSRGFEAGDDKELKIVQDFVRQKSGTRQLADRLHAIWFGPSSIRDCDC